MIIKLRDALFVIIFLFVVSLVYIYFDVNDNNKEQKVKIVENSTDYYDVAGIVDKFVRLSTSKDKDKIISLLENQFKKENKIAENNVFKYVKEFTGENISFTGDLIYYEEITDNIKKYYVSGKVVKQTIDGNIAGKDYYLIVFVDSKNSTFSIIPDNGNLFKGVAK